MLVVINEQGWDLQHATQWRKTSVLQVKQPYWRIACLTADEKPITCTKDSKVFRGINLTLSYHTRTRNKFLTHQAIFQPINANALWFYSSPRSSPVHMNKHHKKIKCTTNLWSCILNQLSLPLTLTTESSLSRRIARKGGESRKRDKTRPSWEAVARHSGQTLSVKLRGVIRDKTMKTLQKNIPLGFIG